jgi:hypothetical protein
MSWWMQSTALVARTELPDIQNMLFKGRRHYRIPAVRCSRCRVDVQYDMIRCRVQAPEIAGGMRYDSARIIRCLHTLTPYGGDE